MPVNLLERESGEKVKKQVMCVKSLLFGDIEFTKKNLMKAFVGLLNFVGYFCSTKPKIPHWKQNN